MNMFAIENVIPDLKVKLEKKGITGKKPVWVSIPPEPAGPERQSARCELVIVCDDISIPWEVKSLPSLFRGNKQAPSFGHGEPPGEYFGIITIFELQIVKFATTVTVPRDVEMEEVYSLIRRRPDGKSTGALHDYVWQATALMLGLFPLSRNEFEAILSRVERSCRTFTMGAGSRNYISALRGML